MKTIFQLLIAIPVICSTAFAESALSVKKNSRTPASNLKLKSSLVPTFQIYHKKMVKGKVEIFKVKHIPALDIGEERQVEAVTLSPLRLPTSKQLVLKEIRRRESPPVLQFELPMSIASVADPKNITLANAFQNIPEVKTLSPFAEPLLQEPLVKLENIEEMKPNDYKLLQALIFLELKKDYELAMGLFAELMDDPVHRIEAIYNYAMTAKGLGLNSEFRQYMIQVTQETKDQKWQQLATEALVKNINVLHTSDIALIEPLVAKFDLNVTTNDDYQIRRAKFYSEKGDLGLMEDALLFISEGSPHYPEALLLSALFNYRQGKIDDAIIQLEKLMLATESDKKTQLRSVAALTLARIQFQKNQYKDAFYSYLKVEKSNPLWLQAMVESAWTQILSEDYEGAAGNMFSLHTDFFKNAFSPESYVVRTVGYLNLCQYGDGAQVLKEMSKKYTPWKKKLSVYGARNRTPTNYYDTVKNWVKNSDLKEVDGLPRAFIVELAQHPAFMKIQGQINTHEDEISRFNKIALTLIKKERELIIKQNQANKALQIAKKENSSIVSAEQKLMSYRIQYHIAKKARLSIKNLRTLGIARIEQEKEVLKLQASQLLQGRYKETVANLERVLDQNEVLQYELYSGAGEHIRYQMAGGEVNKNERPELKVHKEQSLNWKFKGEIWEDEVGHYRSSLKNVCPQENSVAGLSN